MPEAPERVALGCVVGVGPAVGSVDSLYFILPVCGGMEIPLDDGQGRVRVITPSAPIAKGLLGKSLGQDVGLRRNREEPEYISLLA